MLRSFRAPPVDSPFWGRIFRAMVRLVLAWVAVLVVAVSLRAPVWLIAIICVGFAIAWIATGITIRSQSTD